MLPYKFAPPVCKQITGSLVCAGAIYQNVDLDLDIIKTHPVQIIMNIQNTPEYLIR